MGEKYSLKKFFLEITAILLGLLFLVPFYFVIANSLKTFSELLLNPAALPKMIQFDNYVRAWEILKFPTVFVNSLIITVLSNVGIVVLSSMAAYRMVRFPTKFNNLFFGLLVASMVIPFQSIMIPLVKVGKTVGLLNNIPGLIAAYLGFGAALSIFLYHGFMKSIPKEIEEAAIVDGCTSYQVFWKIIFPLMKPMTVTVLVLNSLWIWNDFLLPSLFLSDPELRTIPLAASSFFAQYTKQWDLALASLVLGVTPIVIFFLAMQKHIIKGITSGSVKG